jgi:hypothetical protein
MIQDTRSSNDAGYCSADRGGYFFGVAPALPPAPALVPQCSKPNTATPAVVPTNTLPSATVGVMNLLPVPN